MFKAKHKVNIEPLRVILLRLKAVAHQENVEDRNLFEQFLDTIYVIGKHGVYELVPELYGLLNIRDEMIRAEVVHIIFC